MVIVSVVMAVLLAVAIVFILVLLAVVLKQRKQIRTLTVVPPLHATLPPTYENVSDIAGAINVELTENVAYRQLNK